MNHIAHRVVPALSDMAQAAWKRYLPVAGCLSCVFLVLLVVSGLDIYR